MIEEILGEKTSRIIYGAGVFSVMSEKRASAAKEVVGGATAVGSGAFKATKGIFGMSKDLALYGAGAGILGGIGYNLLKERMQRSDPEERLNRKIESLYARKNKELESAKWMSKIRAMRDDLRRNYKKMSTEEYTKKYNELIAALEENA